jgi:hypothetical protein
LAEHFPQSSSLKIKQQKNTQACLDIFSAVLFIRDAIDLLSNQTISFLENFIQKLT